MKKLIVLAAALSSVLAGCVAYEVPVATTGYYSDRPASTYRDRDGDGVPNRHDTRPNNPRRY